MGGGESVSMHLPQCSVPLPPNVKSFHLCQWAAGELQRSGYYS